MSLVVTIPEQGQLVEVRQRRYAVVEVTKSALPIDVFAPGTMGQISPGQHLVSLTSLDDDALGEELQVIWEIEPGAKVIEKTQLPAPLGFDPPHRLDAFLHAVHWGAASSANTKELQAPFRSGVVLEDYQLDPVARGIQMPRVNLLIADDVGLGKTIEAGLVCQELLIRHRARKILIVCPAALQVQWRDQMRDKFGLEFRIVDSELSKTLRRERGLHVNPWTHFPRLITSIDFLKRERPFRLMSEILPAEGKLSYPRTFDLLILDEAHNVAPSGGGKIPIDSQRTQAIRRLAPHCEHKLFLSATPHNGYRQSFAALLELLDNQRFNHGVVPDREQLGAIMVRRLKSELLGWDGAPRFPKRELAPLEVDYTVAEREVHRLLNRYCRMRLEGATDEIERYATEFVLKLLKKRLFSSPAAFATTLYKHEQSLQEAKRRGPTRHKPGMGILRRQVEQVEEENDDDAALDEATLEALELTAPLFHEATTDELAVLRQMRTWADSACQKPDSKTRRLIEWLRETIKPGGVWSDERVIIFTEYRATQNWLVELLVGAGVSGDDRLLLLYGGMKTEDREKIKAAFQANPRESKVRILLATDAASEGIDLQNYCHRLIHYEIPWNPNRMEQRNGRIDRHGQHAAQVLISHFVSSTYRDLPLDATLPVGELEADLEFLMRAVRKVEKIREDLGKVGPVIADQVEEAMLGRRRRLDTQDAEDKAGGVRRMLRFERKLQEQIERLHEQLITSRQDLGLTPENIQAVVEIALDLAGKPPLRRDVLHDPNGEKPAIPVFYLPPLEGSWASCAAGLAHPHTGRVRPLVFDHAQAQDRDDVVLAHLNHRLVSMCLRLLRSEVWSQTMPDGRRGLYRVTARSVPNTALDTPAVIAHARLMLLGGDSQRLHEEVITAGGVTREGRFARLNVGEVAKALAAAGDTPVSDAMQQRLAALWPTLQVPLFQALEARMRDRQDGVQKLLADRQEKEIHDITAILTELRESILKELKQPDVVQLQMAGFSETEHQQRERDLSTMQLRAEQIPAEIIQETEAIRSRFADPQPRLFPVAVTFLVPEKLAR